MQSPMRERAQRKCGPEGRRGANHFVLARGGAVSSFFHVDVKRGLCKVQFLPIDLLKLQTFSCCLFFYLSSAKRPIRTGGTCKVRASAPLLSFSLIQFTTFLRVTLSRSTISLTQSSQDGSLLTNTQCRLRTPNHRLIHSLSHRGVPRRLTLISIACLGKLKKRVN